MSIIVSLGDRIVAGVQRQLGQHSRLVSLLTQTESGGRLLDGIVIWVSWWLAWGFLYLFTEKVLTPYSGAQSFLGLKTGASSVFAWLAPVAGFLWGPTSKGARQERKLNFNQIEPIPAPGCIVLTIPNRLDKILFFTAIIAFFCLRLLPFKLICFLGPWALFPVILRLFTNEWLEIDLENKTLRRFWFFCGDSWTTKQLEVSDCTALIWGGFVPANSELESHQMIWLTLVLASREMLNIYCLSTQTGASARRPPDTAIELSEKLALPLLLTSEALPLEKLQSVYLSQDAETFSIWDPSTEEPEIDFPEVSDKLPIPKESGLKTNSKKVEREDPLEEMDLE